jgi:hypothetical protein
MLGRAIVLGLAVATLSGITASAGWDDIHRLGRAADDTQAGMNSSGISPALTHSDELMAQAVTAPKARATSVPKSSASPQAQSAGWYSNNAAGGMAIIYEDSSTRIAWGNSYVYQYPGADPLYWYAQIIYTNITSPARPLSISCIGVSDPSLVRENMRGTPNSGMVAAEETFCSRNPNFTGSIGPEGFFAGWAIFHEVPWTGGEVSLELGPFVGPWVDPWYQSLSNVPPPAECPTELVTLGLCQPGSSNTLWSKMPNRSQQRNQPLPLLTQ